ncbi:hypothetical protein GH733_009081 [Mirounga leonina]|nr:hypothetical protein GH733_009081 [Mirounga leonina]
MKRLAGGTELTDFAGDKGYLPKENLRVLMEKQFPGYLENQKDSLAVDKIMKNLDLDQCRDGKVDFQSFFSLIAGLTIAFPIHVFHSIPLHSPSPSALAKVTSELTAIRDNIKSYI